MVSEKHSLVARTSFTTAPPDEFGCAVNALPRCGPERYVPTRRVAVAAPILIRTEDFIARPCHSPKHVAISPARFPRYPRRQPTADGSLSRGVLRLLMLAFDSYLLAILFPMLTTRTRRFSGPKGLSLFLSLVLP